MTTTRAHKARRPPQPAAGGHTVTFTAGPRGVTRVIDPLSGLRFPLDQPVDDVDAAVAERLTQLPDHSFRLEPEHAPNPTS